MTRRFVPPIARQLSDPDAENVRRSHAESIAVLQKAAAGIPTVLAGIELADGIETPIAHLLGRKPVWVRESCPRNGVTVGSVVEVRSGTVDRSKVVVLRADGWGATITVDVAVL